MMTDTVPYTKLTKKAEEKCLDLLVRANILLKKWAECFVLARAGSFASCCSRAIVTRW